jgi:hypothetical protein
MLGRTVILWRFDRIGRSRTGRRRGRWFGFRFPELFKLTKRPQRHRACQGILR